MIKRNVEIKVRLSRKEAETLNKRVKKSGISREAYIRHLVEGGVPREAPPPDYYAMMREIYAIGKNLNQIAQKAHVGKLVLGHFSAQFLTAESEQPLLDEARSLFPNTVLANEKMTIEIGLQ